MKIGLAQEISDGLGKKADQVTILSQEITRYFADKTYGSELEQLFIGIVCVKPEFEFFFKLRKKFTKSKKQFEFDVRIDFDVFSRAKEKDVRCLLLDKIIVSLKTEFEELNLKDFDFVKFEKDFSRFEAACK